MRYSVSDETIVEMISQDGQPRVLACPSRLSRAAISNPRVVGGRAGGGGRLAYFFGGRAFEAPRKKSCIPLPAPPRTYPPPGLIRACRHAFVCIDGARERVSVRPHWRRTATTSSFIPRAGKSWNCRAHTHRHIHTYTDTHVLHGGFPRACNGQVRGA